MKTNQKIRDAAKKAHVNLWEIAYYLGISEPTMTRWLRVPLSPEKERKIVAAIEKLSKGA